MSTSIERDSTIDQQSTVTKEHEMIDIPNASSPWSKPPSPPPYFPSEQPCRDLLEGSREDILNVCVPLYRASIIADWQAAEVILKERPELVRFAINKRLETPLHVVVSVEGNDQRTYFVDNLVQIMRYEDLKLRDIGGRTALCSAAMAGNVQFARLMLRKNHELPNIPDCRGRIPMYIAAICGKHEMVRFLHTVSNQVLTSEHWAMVLEVCISSNMFDVALNIATDVEKLSMYEHVLSNQSHCHSILYALAQNTEAFEKRQLRVVLKIVNQILSVINMKVGPDDKDSDAMMLLRYIWGKILRMHENDIYAILRGPVDTHDYLKVLFVAAKSGNTAFVVELLRSYPDLISETDHENLTIFHIAVMNRHVGIYNLIHETGSMKNSIVSLEDREGNNMLHLVGETSKYADEMSKKFLTIVQDYQWYKEVEMTVPPVYREKKNANGYTPYQLFSRSNQSAWYESLMWADYGLVVATLVLGSSFAATFSVPGGFNQDSGFPIFISKPFFSVFAVADATAFFASLISVTAFLSVVIFGRGRKEKFLDSLPIAMILGLTSLIASLMSMSIALSASLIILYQNSLRWIISPIFACFSLITLTFLYGQFPLMMDMVLSTYSSRRLFSGKTSIFYDKKLT